MKIDNNIIDDVNLSPREMSTERAIRIIKTLMRDISYSHPSKKIKTKLPQIDILQALTEAIKIMEYNNREYVKRNTGKYISYNRKWLYDNLEQEFNILKNARDNFHLDKVDVEGLLQQCREIVDLDDPKEWETQNED